MYRVGLPDRQTHSRTALSTGRGHVSTFRLPSDTLAAAA